MTTPERIRLTAALVDLSTREVLRDDGDTHLLTRSEDALFRFLVPRAGRLVGREELLREVWGYREGVRTRTIDTTMGRLRRKIEADPARPDHLLTVFGGGFRLELPAVEAMGLVGRSADRRALEAATEGHRLVTLVGPGGVGKTALARVWTRAHPGAQWVDLSGTSTLTDFVGVLVEAAGGAIRGDDPIQGALAALARKPLVLVLDNLDTVTGPAAASLSAWVEQAPDLRVLCTSRQALGLAGEVVLTLKPLPPESARKLFFDRAREVEPDLDLSDEVLDAVATRLDGLPLAIELAASRLNVLTVDALVERLVAFDHRDLLESVRRSWDLLDGEQKLVLSQVALFRSTFDAEAAEAVIGDPGRDALTVLDGLKRHSLLQIHRGEIRLYEAVRQFAAQQPADPEAVLRWGRWLAERTEPRWALDQTAACEALARLEPDTALKVLHRRVQQHVQLGESRAAVELTEGVAALSTRASGRGASHGLLARAKALSAVGRYADAIRACAEARERAEGAMVAEAWFQEATCHLAQAHLDELGACLDRAEAATEDADLRIHIAVHRANIQRIKGHTEGALRVFEAAMEAHRGAPNTLGRTTLAVNYGSALMESGRPDLALAMLAQAADQASALGRSTLVVLCHANQAEALRSQGRFAEARPLYDAALDAVRAGRVGAAIEPILLIQLSALEQEDGDLNRAALLASRALLCSGDTPRYHAIARVQVGGVHHERGWILLARDAYTVAREELLAVGDERIAALVEARLAALEAAHDVEAAQTWLDLSVAHAGDDPQLRLTHRLFAGHLELARGVAVDALLRTVDQPAPGDPAPTPASWNPEVRFAAKMLRAARGARAANGVRRGDPHGGDGGTADP